MPGPQLSAAARYCFTHPVSPHTVGRGLDPSAARRGRRPLQRWPEITPHPRTFLPAPAHPSTTPVGAGHARPATSRRLPSILLLPTTPIICARQPASPQYTPCPNFALKLCRKNQKTCKNLLTKVILLAIIIKLSREPSPRRQPLEPLPTACTPFFEENFFKKLSENLLTNERI